MVTIGMNYEALPGKEGVFEKAFQDVLKAMGGMSGHSESFLYKEVDNPHRYLIISDWSDEQAFTDFIRSETFAEVTSWSKAEVLAGRPTHKVYHPKT